MEKELIEKYKGKLVKIGLKPNNFTISGYIVDVFDDCFRFETTQKSSILNFDAIMTIIPLSG